MDLNLLLDATKICLNIFFGNTNVVKPKFFACLDLGKGPGGGSWGYGDGEASIGVALALSILDHWVIVHSGAHVETNSLAEISLFYVLTSKRQAGHEFGCRGCGEMLP